MRRPPLTEVNSGAKRRDGLARLPTTIAAPRGATAATMKRGMTEMDADQIVEMTPEAIRTLIDSRQIKVESKHSPGKRMQERWPFPGTVEVWLPDPCYGERHVLATLHNLSPSGLAMRTRRPVPSETRISIAIHQPELSCYGHAVVRHCTRAPVGYLVGVEFFFGSEDENEAGSA